MLKIIFLQPDYLLLRTFKKNTVKKIITIPATLFLAVIVVTAVAFCSLKKSPAKNESPVATPGFAVMELFTSQGCSSCPAADELLGKYAAQNNPDIITLSLHVDYWNRLGWKDSFSDAAFSERQRRYARTIAGSSVYTPQLVVNGSTEMVGSDEAKITASIKRALSQKPIAAISISSHEVSNGTLKIKYAATGNLANTNVLALLVQNNAITKIKAGENKGAMLTGYNIVKTMVSNPAKTEGECRLEVPDAFEPGKFSVVLLLQQTDKLTITGVVKLVI